MRIMRDSTSAADIPADTPMVAGYVDGSWPWSAADWARFPNAVHVRITVGNTEDADAIDVETGDASPAYAGGWVRRRNAAGKRPLVYCNRSTRPAVESACAGLSYDLWIATLDGVQSMQPGAVATQWQGQAQSGKHYDESMVIDGWAPSGPASAPSPAPAATQHVVPAGPVMGHTFGNPTQWYDYDTLAALNEPLVPAGVTVYWTEAKLVNGKWWDRIAKDASGTPGNWAMADADVDDGGFDPPHFAPAPQPTPPAPQPAPQPTPPAPQPTPPAPPVDNGMQPGDGSESRERRHGPDAGPLP